MTNDTSLIICQFCHLHECDGVEDATARKLRQQVRQGEEVAFPGCPLLRAYVFNFHQMTAEWCQQFDLDDAKVSRCLKRYTDQMVDRYEIITTE